MNESGKKGVIKSIVESYSDTLDRIKEFLSKNTEKEVQLIKESDFYNDTLKDKEYTSFDNYLCSFRNSKYKVVRECTLHDNKIYSILSRIEELKNKLIRK